MNKQIYILGIVILIIIIILFLINKKTFKNEHFYSQNFLFHRKRKSFSNNSFLNKDPIIPTNTDLCNTTSAFMSIKIKPTFLLIKPINNCNVNLHLFKYDGKNIDINTSIIDNDIINFGKVINNTIQTDDTTFIPAPLKIMNITLNDLKLRGGLYYDHNNVITQIIPINCNLFSLEKYTLELIEPYANTRQQSDNLMFFKGDNGLVGEIHGYRDKNQNFIMEWICWRKNDEYLSYGTVMANP